MHKIYRWEEAISGRDDIELLMVMFKFGKVARAYGYIMIAGKKHRAMWHADGRCFCNHRHFKPFDISL